MMEKMLDMMSATAQHTNWSVAQLRNMMLFEMRRTLLNSPRYKDPRHLAHFEHKVYSQNGEDGVIREIFNRIGVTDKYFVEFGVEKGLENNTLALCFDGWKGVWIDAGESNVQQIRSGYQHAIQAGILKIINSFITRENINGLIAGALGQQQVDLLSIDIDGNDVHIFEAITCINPRVVVIEYNAKFPPPMMYCMAYDEHHMWRGDDCFGASLKYLEVKFAAKGYHLVGCDLAGINAFFVRADLTGEHFSGPYTAENYYEPARYHLAAFPSGHAPSHRTLETSAFLADLK